VFDKDIAESGDDGAAILAADQFGLLVLAHLLVELQKEICQSRSDI